MIFHQWNAVALWAWDIVVDNCAICRNHIMDLCEFTRRFLSQMSLGCFGELHYRYVHLIRYWVPGQPSICDIWGMHCSLGCLQCTYQPYVQITRSFLLIFFFHPASELLIPMMGGHLTFLLILWIFFAVALSMLKSVNYCQQLKYKLGQEKVWFWLHGYSLFLSKTVQCNLC